jgi:hypothetical protein
MNPEKKQKILSGLVEALKTFILEQLKGAAIKAALKAFLKSGAGLGFKEWLIKFVAEELFEEVAEPVIKYVFVRAGYEYRRHEGNILVKRLQRAQDENSEADYNSTVDDIFS